MSFNVCSLIFKNVNPFLPLHFLGFRCSIATKSSSFCSDRFCSRLQSREPNSSSSFVLARASFACLMTPPLGLSQSVCTPSVSAAFSHDSFPFALFPCGLARVTSEIREASNTNELKVEPLPTRFADRADKGIGFSPNVPLSAVYDEATDDLVALEIAASEPREATCLTGIFTGQSTSVGANTALVTVGPVPSPASALFVPDILRRTFPQPNDDLSFLVLASLARPTLAPALCSDPLDFGGVLITLEAIS